MDNNTIVEKVVLPSKGKIYNGNVSAELTLRSMTTAEEMKRTNSSIANGFKLMSEIIDDCIVNKPAGFTSYDLCIGDYTYLLHKLRVVTHGTDYKLNIKCPQCLEESDYVMDLDNDLAVNEYKDEYEELRSVRTPVGNRTFKLRFQTPRDFDLITSEKDDMIKRARGNLPYNPDIMLILANAIESIDGAEYTHTQLLDIVKKLNFRDANKLLNRINQLNGGDLIGPSQEFLFVCPKCGHKQLLPFRKTPEFYRPSDN
jgi:hypothetical protein